MANMYDRTGITTNLGNPRASMIDVPGGGGGGNHRRGPYHLANRDRVRNYVRPARNNVGYSYDAYEIDGPDFRTDRDFKAYAARIETIILDSPDEEPLKIREIHDRLGDDARREWTLDAIESLKTVETLPGLVDRYQPVGGWIPTADLSQQLQEN